MTTKKGVDPKKTSDPKSGMTKNLLKDAWKLEERMTQDLLEKKDDSKNLRREAFSKIEKKVKASLKKQDTDEALQSISVGALFLGSSDIHYDNWEESVKIRFRIDGMLVDIFDLDKKDYKKLLERLKYASEVKLNITDVPQDGKYDFMIDQKKIDVRLSTLPTKYGENIVCRLLDGSDKVLNFEDLWFYWTSQRMIRKSMNSSMGMILVTWPTGSWKTTTLYTILSHINDRSKKIMTLEDPIEYNMEWVIQSEIDEKKWYHFSTGLRALLRQDPDVIMVWEIRDLDTLQTATSAALTGHLVLSTLHTKSAAETLDRIISMGLQSYILSGALETIIAQRLIRRICPHCKKEVEVTKDQEAVIKMMMKNTGMKDFLADHIKLYSGAWCQKCNGTGYKGRIWIYEIMNMDDEIRNLIKTRGSSEEVLKIARKNGMILMKEDGILKAMWGHTTIEEVLRVV